MAKDKPFSARAKVLAVLNEGGEYTSQQMQETLAETGTTLGQVSNAFYELRKKGMVTRYKYDDSTVYAYKINSGPVKPVAKKTVTETAPTKNAVSRQERAIGVLNVAEPRLSSSSESVVHSVGILIEELEKSKQEIDRLKASIKKIMMACSELL